MTEEAPTPAAEDASAPMSVADKARAQAEARRARILGKANKRLGLVSGETHKDEETKATSVSNAARIRAARQRRYGKKSAATTEAKREEEAEPAPVPAVEETGSAEAASPSEAAAPTNDEDDVDAEEGSVPVGDTPTEVYAGDAEEHGAKEPETAPKSDSAADPQTADGEDGEGKKKYRGIARTRRRMLMKKKQESESAEAPASASRSAPSVGTVTTAPKPLAPLVPKMPIYMHIVMVFMLFIAGMDIGLQQFHEGVFVHPIPAISQYGVPVLHRSLSLEPEEYATDPQMKELLRKSSSTSTDSYSQDEDEFSEQEEEEKEPNIDPLFRVDLDEMTKEPTFLNSVARVAISVHRFFLTIFYYWPVSVVANIFHLPLLLLRLPPYLCLIALILRQVVGNVVLGARIPNIEDGSKKGKDSSMLDIDVMGMIKKAVTGFLSSTFPNMAGLYESFTHLRTDVYIVFCGMFCGIVWAQYNPVGGTIKEPKDEL